MGIMALASTNALIITPRNTASNIFHKRTALSYSPNGIGYGYDTQGFDRSSRQDVDNHNMHRLLTEMSYKNDDYTQGHLSFMMVTIIIYRSVNMKMTATVVSLMLIILLMIVLIRRMEKKLVGSFILKCIVVFNSNTIRRTLHIVKQVRRS